MDGVKISNMRNIFFKLLLLLLMASCQQKSEVDQAVTAIPVAIKVSRFDKIFFESNPSELSMLKKDYPDFFPKDVPDSIWIEKMTNPMWKELYNEVQKKYGNFEGQKTEIEDLFKHAKYYFPDTPTPEVITVIAEMDYNNKVIYTGDMVLIALELYLGKDHEFYQSEFPAYIRQNFEAHQIIPDIVSAFAVNKVPEPTNKNLLSQMIFAGKELYLKDLMIPDYSDADKIGYTPEQVLWCEENENYMWRYFLEENLLYDSDSKLASRFINKAPFSKFYLEIDNESPGRVGAWIGWQIVRSYMQNNHTGVQQMLLMDNAEIFNRSKYKPKK